MAVYCPLYDAIDGWYILVCGPKGTYKQLIISPLHYYYAMGVEPPVGSQFTQQELEDFQLEMEVPLSASTPGGVPTYAVAIPASVAPQAAGAFGSGFDDLPYLQDPLSLPSAGPSFAYDTLYGPLTSSLVSISQLPALVTPSASSLVSLENLAHPSATHQFKPLFSSPVSPYGVVIANPLAASNANISSNSSLLLSSPVSSVPSSMHKKYNNEQSYYSPMGSYSPQSSMSSGFNYKYNNPKLSSSSMNLSPSPSMSSGFNNYDSLHSAASILKTPPVSSNPKFKSLNPQFSSTFNSKLDYYYPSVSTSSSGKGKVLPPLLNTPHPPAPSAANTSNTNKSSVSSAIYDNLDVAYEMYMDEVQESPLDEDNYDMSEP